MARSIASRKLEFIKSVFPNFKSKSAPVHLLGKKKGLAWVSDWELRRTFLCRKSLFFIFSKFRLQLNAP